MSREANSVELPERRGRRRRKADPEPYAPKPPREAHHEGDRMNPEQTAGALQKDPSPSAVPDDERRFERVRQKAYELYLRRGEAPGDDVNDWLEAERQVDGER